ncbi:MAG: type-F conjugative transfer system secretin TraK [Sideroxydans sp.]|nr:type-F conjugative transfer system secretin TraK [Sideroxydans sp.]MDD5056626.1 type-F conjugative transfer system secretin TraK [Sideroxydans sp.]
MKRELILSLLFTAISWPSFAEQNLSSQAASDVQSSSLAVVQQTPPAAPAKKRRKLPGVAAYTLDTRNALPLTVVPVGNDGTRVVLLSKVFTNRISTPFSAPRVIDSSNVDIKQDGSSIFVSPKTTDPFAIYVTGSEPGDQVISLTLIPKDIPAQTIVLQADTTTVVRQQKTESYTQQLVDLLRRVALGKVPDGFSEGRMPNAVAINGELSITPKSRYSGSWMDIYRYTILNNSKETVELSETSFYRKGVRAVAIYPNLTLRSGDTTDVYVVADKSALDGN